MRKVMKKLRSDSTIQLSGETCCNRLQLHDLPADSEYWLAKQRCKGYDQGFLGLTYPIQIHRANQWIEHFKVHFSWFTATEDLPLRQASNAMLVDVSHLLQLEVIKEMSLPRNQKYALPDKLFKDCTEGLTMVLTQFQAVCGDYHPPVICTR